MNTTAPITMGFGALPMAQPITAEEFVRQYNGQRVELRNGRIVELPMPNAKHGKIVSLFSFYLNLWILKYDLGHVVTNDSWIRTNRGPDSVRGPDLFYISYERQPKGPLPEGLLDQNPELCIEVKSPSESWRELEAKAREYLEADVKVVVLIDPTTQSVVVYRQEKPPQSIANGQDLTLPDLFPEFSVNVGKLFE